MRSALYPLLLSTIGCSDWPIHEKAYFSTDGLPAHLSDSEAISALLDWNETAEEDEENNDYARVGEWMMPGTGWHIEGQLSGLGWDNEAVPSTSSSSDCDASLAFPPSIGSELFNGDYAGDIDWVGLLARGSGTLCVSVQMYDAEDISALRYDLLLYQLNACGDPISVRADENYEILGFSSGGARTSWSTTIDSGEILGLVLSGYKPDDLDLDVSWKLAVSLIDFPTNGICPTPPW